ncbi:hypothetical protein DL93DRAFT_2087135 [Clavulina sp. PMI_390]|nr:hypothetical protein DL93DRAFT_2087135 [Clavulina sp. PMI_390]
MRAQVQTLFFVVAQREMSQIYAPLEDQQVMSWCFETVRLAESIEPRFPLMPIDPNTIWNNSKEFPVRVAHHLALDKRIAPVREFLYADGVFIAEQWSAGLAQPESTNTSSPSMAHLQPQKNPQNKLEKLRQFIGLTALMFESDSSAYQHLKSQVQTVASRLGAMPQGRVAKEVVEMWIRVFRQIRGLSDELKPAHKVCGTLGCTAIDGELLQCTRCKARFYCSRDCQVKDWKMAHKRECGK